MRREGVRGIFSQRRPANTYANGTGEPGADIWGGGAEDGGTEVAIDVHNGQFIKKRASGELIGSAEAA
jgi:hypothetical protein